MRGALSNVPRFIRRSAAAITTVLASTIVSLLVLEAAVRVWNGAPLTSTENFVARELNAVVGEKNPPAQYDERLGWVHVPNARFALGDLIFGDQGVRMPSHQIVPLQEGAVLVVGDSFGAGSEVNSPDSWPAQLERTAGTQVINAAVGAYGLDQIVLRAEDLLPRLKPRLLLVQTRLEYGISVNRMSINGGAPKPYFHVHDGKLVLENEPVPRIASMSRDIGWTRSVLGHSYLIEYMMTRLNLLQWWVSSSMATKIVLSNEEAVEVTCLLMRRIAELRDRSNVRIGLIFQYSGTDGIGPTLGWETDRARVVGCAEQNRLDVVDVLDPLRSVYRDEGLSSYQRLWVMHDNNRLYGHMSAEGNRLIANLVFRQLFNGKTSNAKVH
jgi:hypothetical protein